MHTHAHMCIHIYIKLYRFTYFTHEGSGYSVVKILAQDRATEKSLPGESYYFL